VETAQKVGEVIQKHFDHFEVDSEMYVSKINDKGAVVTSNH
jgi:hypothetical protein